jgi:hypothetical protein
MVKHLFGVAIFISIVTAAVFVYGFFNTLSIPEIPAVGGNLDTVFPNKWSSNNLAVRIVTAEYDTRAGTLTADIALTWKGAEIPPAMLVYRIHLLDGSRSAGSLAIRSDSAITPFRKGRSSARRVVFTRDEMGRFADLHNIYMYIETDGAYSITSRSERLSNAVFVPVLRIH